MTDETVKKQSKSRMYAARKKAFLPFAKKNLKNLAGANKSPRWYLETMYRIMWFRHVYRNGRIITERIPNADYPEVKAYIYNDDDVLLATGHAGAIDKGNAVWSGRALEKAETAAIGRALAHAGFGTQFMGESEIDDGHLSDRPVESTKNNQPTHSGKPAQPPPADVADWYASETTRRAFLELMRKEIANPSWAWEAVIAECERLSPGFKKMATGKEAAQAIKAAFETEQLGKTQTEPAAAFDVTALDAWVQQSFDLHLDELPELLNIKEAWTTFQTLEAAQARIRAATHATRTPVIASSVTMKQLGKGRQMVFHTALGDIGMPGGRGEVSKKLGKDGDAYGDLVKWTDWKDGSTYQLEGASLMVTWNEVENRLTVTGLKPRTPIQPAAKPAPFSGLDDDVDAANAADQRELTDAEAESIPF